MRSLDDSSTTSYPTVSLSGSWWSGLGIIVALVLFALGCSPPNPDWQRVFGYSSSDVHEIEIDSYGYPRVSVTVGTFTVMLPFDTGNMVGLSLNPTLFDQLRLATVNTYDRLNSAGEAVATLRVSPSQTVEILGKSVGERPIYEFDHSTLPGVVGPSFLEGKHFTLDYRSRQIAFGDGLLPKRIPGYRAVPLVRSHWHRTLILVWGTAAGRSILMELDTGKSRTVINPQLAVELDLEPVSRGVRIDRLGIAGLSFDVPSAKKVDQTAIDPGLPEPILLGVGSDILSQFVWTVDYDAGVLWVPALNQERP